MMTPRQALGTRRAARIHKWVHFYYPHRTATEWRKRSKSRARTQMSAASRWRNR